MASLHTEPPIATVPAASPSRSTWAVVGLLMATAGMSHFNRVSIAAAGDARIMDQYGIEPTRMGMVYSAFLLSYTLMMIPGGLFLDRFRPRLSLAVVLFGSALFVALTGVVGLTIRDGALAFGALVVVRGLMGVVSAPLHPSCAAAVARWVRPGARARTNGIVNGTALVGIALTQVGFGAMIRVFDWPVSFLITATATALLAAAWWTFAAEPADRPDLTTRPRPDDAPVPWRSLLVDRNVMLLTASYAAAGYFQYLFVYWMNYYFKNTLKLPETTSQLYAAIPPLGMALGMPLGGWLSDWFEMRMGGHWGRRIVPMGGMAVGAGLLGLGVLAREPVWIVAWFGLAMAAVGMSEGPFWASAIELGSRQGRGGSAAAIVNTGGNAGGMLAPVLTPMVGLAFGWPAAVALGGVICMLGVVLWLGIDVGDHEPAPAS